MEKNKHTLKDKCEMLRSSTDYRLPKKTYVMGMIDGKGFSKLIKNHYNNKYKIMPKIIEIQSGDNTQIQLQEIKPQSFNTIKIIKSMSATPNPVFPSFSFLIHLHTF